MSSIKYHILLVLVWL